MEDDRNGGRPMNVFHKTIRDTASPLGIPAQATTTLWRLWRRLIDWERATPKTAAIDEVCYLLSFSERTVAVYGVLNYR